MRVAYIMEIGDAEHDSRVVHFELIYCPNCGVPVARVIDLDFNWGCGGTVRIHSCQQEDEERVVPSKNQLDLVTLTVSPEEARMIATALQMRSLHLVDATPFTSPERSPAYTALRRKVEYQAGASQTP